MRLNNLTRAATFVLFAITLNGCGGNGPAVVVGNNNFSVGGTVTNLLPATTLVLQNNGGNNLTLNSNGSFTFTTPLASGSSYTVTVLTQPANQNCSINNPSGTISTNVFNVTVTCLAGPALQFFGAIDGVFGAELWKTDGTDLGTQLVKDIRVGAGSSVLSGASFGAVLTGMTYFRANDGVIGEELWRTDGTLFGTQLVADIAANGGSFPRELTVFNGQLYFNADDGISGSEAWVSNGTALGTHLLKDINPGSRDSEPEGGFTELNGALYFIATDGDFTVTGSEHGFELWKTDGTSSGTALVKDIRVGVQASTGPQHLTPFNGALYFSANDGVNGVELWKSDGTASGTVLVANVNPGNGNSSPNSLTVFNGALYFSADDGTNGRELWKTDGTTIGTVLVKDIDPALLPTGSGSPQGFTVLNGALYFSAGDVTNGRELWKTDGTAVGTTQVKDINPNSGSSNPNSLFAFNGAIYFSANDGQHGNELWKTNGSGTGTVLVKDLDSTVFPAIVSSAPQDFRIVGSTLLFRANTTTNGAELWKTDGTEAGTLLFKDICPLTCNGVGN